MNGPQIHFVGVLNRDPEECVIGDDIYARLRVGVHSDFHDARDSETLVFWVHLFGHEADSALERCRRGQSVYVYGRYSEKVITSQDNTVRFIPLVFAQEFHVIS